jgi:tRNA (guanine37-N1)-methyltransferase
MIMKVEPIFRAIEHVKEVHGRARFVLLSPQGRRFDQFTAERFARSPHICFICGRYEGVDDVSSRTSMRRYRWGTTSRRAGSSPALVIIDAVCRFIPGVLGNDESVSAESFREPSWSTRSTRGLRRLWGPQCRPFCCRGTTKRLRKWRRKEAIRKTVLRRSDLLEGFQASDEDRRFMREIMEEFPE